MNTLTKLALTMRRPVVLQPLLLRPVEAIKSGYTGQASCITHR